MQIFRRTGAENTPTETGTHYMARIIVYIQKGIESGSWLWRKRTLKTDYKMDFYLFDGDRK